MKKRDTLKKSQTDWERIKKMRDEDIDLSDIPEIEPSKFAKAIVRKGLKTSSGKVQLTLRIDQDVVEWFKDRGRGYQTKINALLRAYMEAHK
nr:BrnA antitoxin family protein [Nitrosomonas nitrosa]